MFKVIVVLHQGSGSPQGPSWTPKWSLMITHQRVPYQRVPYQSVPSKGSPKKGSPSKFVVFSCRPPVFSKRPLRDTLNVHKSRMYTKQESYMGLGDCIICTPTGLPNMGGGDGVPPPIRMIFSGHSRPLFRHPLHQQIFFLGFKKNFGQTIFFGRERYFFFRKKHFCQKKFLVQKNFWSNFFCPNKNFSPKKFWSKKKILVRKKCLSPKKFLAEKNLSLNKKPSTSLTQALSLSGV